MKHYYAISYPCGVAVHSNTGKRYGCYYRFASKKSRREWIDRGGDFRTGPNWREAIPSKDPELRAILRKDADDPWDYIEDGDAELEMLSENQ